MKKHIQIMMIFFSLFIINIVPVNASSQVEALMAKMTLREKISQLMMMDFRTWNNQNFTTMNPAIKKLIQTYDFGGIILFKENLQSTSQVYKLTSSIQDAAKQSKNKIPLFIGTDQEGGIVHRISSGCAMPGNMAIGATHNENYAKRAGTLIGKELSALGINTNFAPCVDVNVNPNNPVIGLRSFSDDPQLVSKLANKMIEGLHQNKVLTAIKHYPGHGDTNTDSHTGLPVVNKSKKALVKTDLLPFKNLSSKTDMVMTAHITYPQIDKSQIQTKKGRIYTPATLSSKMINILRKDYHYNGVIVTDALNMGAISQYLSPEEAAIKALNAGVDLLLMPIIVHGDQDVSSFTHFIDHIEQAVKKKTISIQRINEAVKHVLTLKNKTSLLHHSSIKQAIQSVGSASHHQEEGKLARGAVTIVKNKNNVLPLTHAKKVLVALPYKNEKPAVELAIRRLKKNLQVDYMFYTKTTTNEEIKKKVKPYDTIICLSEIVNVKSLSSSHYMTRVPTQLMAQHKTGIIVSIANPQDVAHYDQADAIIAVYGNTGMDPTESLMPEKAYGPNIVAGIETLFTYQDQLGQLPVNIYHYDEKNQQFTNRIVYKRGYGLSYKKVKISTKHKKTNNMSLIIMGVGALLLMCLSLYIKRRLKCHSLKI